MIEARWLPDFAGNNTSPNAFSKALINNLSSKMKSPLFIRVGGTSSDNAMYNASQKDAVIVTGPPQPIPNHTRRSFGTAWLEAFKQFTSVKWDVMVPLAHFTVDDAANVAKAVLGAIGNQNLNLIEIGNEPDLFPTIDRPATYKAAQYSPEFVNYSNGLRSRLALPSGPIFQAGSIGSNAQPGWTAYVPLPIKP